MISVIKNSHFNSRIEDNGILGNLKLTIELKVLLVKYYPRQKNDPARHYQRFENYMFVDWDEVSWSRYKRNLKKVWLQAWNEKLCLIPNEDGIWTTYLDGFATRKNVDCKVRVVLVNANPHWTITVKRLKDDSVISTDGSLRPYIKWKRRVGLLFSKNIIPNGRYDQIAATHEFGHMLGLSHPKCRGNTNACYGSLDDIMGIGKNVLDWHAYPWKVRLQKHLGTKMCRKLSWSIGKYGTPPISNGRVDMSKVIIKL